MSDRPLYGLVGRSISHSFSPDYFKKKFFNEGIPADYILFDIDSIDKLPDVISSKPNLRGFNVTIPYKKEIMALLQHVSPEAQSVGAVNTVKVTDSGLWGYNTDVAGFRNSLLPLIGRELPLKALVLGTGGASEAARYVLNELSIPFQIVSRKKSGNTLTYSEIDKWVLQKTRLIINTTPLGMYPDINQAPDIAYEHLSKYHILYDLIYNPEETLFLKEGKRAGAKVKNGLEMLHLQAEASWKIWQE